MIKIGETEIQVNEELYRIIHEHYKSGETLDALADKLGLSGWGEAFKLIQALPQWVLWFTPTQLEEHLKGAETKHKTQRRGRRKKVEEQKQEKTSAPSTENKE
jgi:hypothetical protein